MLIAIFASCERGSEVIILDDDGDADDEELTVLIIVRGVTRLRQ